MPNSLFINNNTKITILIAPLDWGLGHATRCIPIIRFLLQKGCKVLIAAEGPQEMLLKTEFPSADFISIPGYRISYTNSKRFFTLKIALQIPKILSAIYKEKKWLSTFLQSNRISAVISDNRYGLFNNKVTSVFITHQLLIKASHLFIQKILQNINYRYITNFSCCWIPDEKGLINMAGKLSHPLKLPKIPVTYLGGLSRLERQVQTEKKINLLIVLSGPEPQRTIFENRLLDQLKTYHEHAVLVRGLPAATQVLLSTKQLEIKNHLPARELEKAFCESEYIICRSGYTSVMDICKLKKKSILIPTPGQTEQEYLASHLSAQGWCVMASQDNFSLKKSLQQAKDFDYQLPDLKMETYKTVLANFIERLEKQHFEQES